MNLQKKITKIYTAPAPLTTIWNKWTTHEGLLTFFGKDNKMELRIGGPFEIYFLMDNPVGLRGSEGCKVLSFLPEKMLSFSWNAPPHFEKIRNGNHNTWVVLEFEKIDDKNTTITLTHLGWLEGEDWDALYEYFDAAWSRVQEWLVNSLM